MSWPLAPSRLAVVEHLGHKSDGRISHIVGPVLPLHRGQHTLFRYRGSQS
jgi:hypothetical protein